MALPALTMPATLPPWLASGYSSAPDSIYGHAAMSTGHTRTRRTATVAYRRERASMRLTAEQIPAWYDFVENDLQAGLLPFSARVANLGPGLVWFDALLLDWPSTPQAGGDTVVECTLLLRGSPSITGPD